VNTFGIVALSLCAGLLLALLLAGVGVLVYFARCIKLSTDRLSAELEKFYAENKAVLDDHAVQFKIVLDSSKANLISMRQEMRASLEFSLKSIQGALSEHQARLDAAISTINANQLLEASKRGITAMLRLERVVAAIEKFRLDRDEDEGDEPRRGGGEITGPWPADRAEEFGPAAATPTGASVYSNLRPDDVLNSEQEEPERIPIGL
jgi:hypothetical protein